MKTLHLFIVANFLRAILINDFFAFPLLENGLDGLIAPLMHSIFLPETGSLGIVNVLIFTAAPLFVLFAFFAEDKHRGKIIEVFNWVLSVTAVLGIFELATFGLIPRGITVFWFFLAPLIIVPLFIIETARLYGETRQVAGLSSLKSAVVALSFFVLPAMVIVVEFFLLS